MKAMVIVPQKVKSVIKYNFTSLIYLILAFLLGGWQTKQPKTLNQDQYGLLNDFFEKEIYFFHQTSISKNWGLDLNQTWLLEKMDVCLIENEEEKLKIVNELIEEKFQSALHSHLLNQTTPSKMEQKKLKESGIKLQKKDTTGKLNKISAPFIYENMALIYIESPLEESVLYLRKNLSGKWEWICKFSLITIYLD